MKLLFTMVATYFGIKVFDKLIEDNLPSLHYKNLLRFWNKYATPVVILAYIGWLSILTKLSNDKQLRKSYETALAIAAISIIYHNMNNTQNPKTETTI